MFCSRCGAQVGEDEKFCRACGQETGASAMPGPITTAGVPAPIPVSAAPSVARLPYAGFWLRLGAYFIDGLILGVPFGIVVVVLIFTLGGFGMMLHRIQANSRVEPPDPSAAMALMAPMFMLFFLGMLGFLILQWLYFAGMESSARQATFGKSVMSVRVTNSEGRRISFGHASGRFFAKIVSGMIPLGLGYIMAGFTEKKQALHDMIAGTLVLKR
jgi:uncharacterized RDD family membrane protein YckC